MKKLVFILFLPLLFSMPVKAQIENVIVETYYISDSLDATDTTAGRILEAGSKTYRIYVDLEAGSKITKIYSDANHALKISSTANFYNNIDRPSAWFGYLINKSWFPDNPTLALDSWITLGLATKTQNGILKMEDTDATSILGGTNNYGGTAGIPGGILINSTPEAGVPLTTADGLTTNTIALQQWVDNGFRDAAGDDTTIFGPTNTGSEFISNGELYLKQSSGVTGPTTDNKILVAQLTTKGELSFELNVEVEDSLGNVIQYVADGTVLINNPGLGLDEHISPYLKYPPACGCMDPNYLEYSAAYSCEILDSCQTLVVLGCMDSMACNYDADANFNIPEVCCYPGHCDDRDISVVCPSLSYQERPFNLYPNPVQHILTLEVSTEVNQEMKYIIYNSFGRMINETQTVIEKGNNIQQINLSHLDTGLYLFRLFKDGVTENRMFFKD